MPVKDLADRGDLHGEEAMDVDSNTNAIQAVDPLSPLHSPSDQNFLKNSSSSDSQIEEMVDDEDPARPSGVVDYVFDKIEDPRAIDLKKELRLLSDPVTIRCLPWKVLLVFAPVCQRLTMGMFLQCNDNNFTSSWTCSARAKLELISQTKSLSKTYRIRHTFAAKENDWGYQAFISYEELFNPENGYVVNNKLHARIEVEADAPHGTEWDSKKYTGFVGLKNQGATCYLNSVLQALYCTNALRKAVFQMPTESDEISTSVPLALQRTFYDLQCSDKAVGTEKLTRSFGWNTWDSFMQHDAQELCRVLLDNMECKMKGTAVEKIIPELFCGKMVSYITCKNVDYGSKREEQFYDIQLKVKGNRDIHEAFKEYVQVETLEGDNKYDAGSHGLQDAEKGIKFLRFPPVLYLQLMRFQYDFVSNTNVKINDRFEFPYDLDLSDYLVQESGQSDEEPRYTKYFLQAVLVHSGDHHGGHYVVYLNPRGDNKWYQFDDDVVCSCRPDDAIAMNYGSSNDPECRAFTNAYMLVYIACDARDKVLCPVTDEMIPFSLSSRFSEERTVEEKERIAKDHAHEFATINLLFDEDFHGFEGPGLMRINEIPIRSLRVKNQEVTESKLVEAIANFIRLPQDKFHLWCVSYQKATDTFEFSRKISMVSHSDGLLTLWIQRTEDAVRVSTAPTSNSSLCFFKFYNPLVCSLCYCGHAELPMLTLVEDLPGLLCERVGLPPATPLIFYRVDCTKMPKPVNLAELTLKLKNGEVIYFHVDNAQLMDTSPADLVAFPNSPPSDIVMETSNAVIGNHNNKSIGNDLPNTSLYLRKIALNGYSPGETLKSQSIKEAFLQYFEASSMLVDILLVDKLRKSDLGIFVRVSPELSYWEFAQLAAGYVSGRPDHLQFFVSHPSNNSGSAVLKNPSVIPTQELHVSTTGNQPPNSETGNGSGFSPSSGGSLISEQSIAAKASGFCGASPALISLLATTAQQALLREPPGPPIPSTTMAVLRDFLALPPGASTITFQTTNPVSVTSQDRPPLCVAHYTGLPRITPSPLHNNVNLYVPAPRRVYYAHTDVAVTELESLKQIQVAFYGPKLTDRIDLALSVPGNGTVADILNEVRSQLPLNFSGKLRLMEIRVNKITQIYDDKYPLEKIDDSLTELQLDASDIRCGLRVEEVPKDEQNLQHGDLVINAAHFNKDPNDTFGTPFTVKVRNGELYSEVKRRIRERLEIVSEKEFDTWNFVLVTPTRSVSIPNGDDVTVDTNLLTRDTYLGVKPWLGVEHKPPKRPRYAPSEKSIKIHN